MRIFPSNNFFWFPFYGIYLCVWRRWIQIQCRMIANGKKLGIRCGASLSFSLNSETEHTHSLILIPWTQAWWAWIPTFLNTIILNCRVNRIVSLCSIVLNYFVPSILSRIYFIDLFINFMLYIYTRWIQDYRNFEILFYILKKGVIKIVKVTSNTGYL